MNDRDLVLRAAGLCRAYARSIKLYAQARGADWLAEHAENLEADAARLAAEILSCEATRELSRPEMLATLIDRELARLASADPPDPAEATLHTPPGA
jgi:hypothetical protein